MAVILLMNISISESKLVHSKMGLKPNQSLKQLQTLKEVGQYVYISWSKTFYAASYNHRKLKVQFWGHMLCQRPVFCFFFFSLSRIYLILLFFFFFPLYSSVISPPPSAHTSLLAYCFWSHLSVFFGQELKAPNIDYKNYINIISWLWFTWQILYFSRVVFDILCWLFTLQLFWELSPNSWNFAGINYTTHCISQDTGACISFKELHNSSCGVMSFFHCYLFISCLLHFLSKSTIPALHLSSAFSTVWVDDFRTRFCSVVTCLVQTRPGKFVWLK